MLVSPSLRGSVPFLRGILDPLVTQLYQTLRKELQSLEGEYYSGILLIQPSVVKLIELAQFDKTTAFWQKPHNLSWN